MHFSGYLYFFPVLFWEEEDTGYITHKFQISIFQLYRRKGEKKSSSLELRWNSNKKRLLLVLQFRKIQGICNFFAHNFVSQLLFWWPVTVRNFPTPCKIQGNCNPGFFTHIPNPMIKGICNFLAHNSQLVQAHAHALREPIPSYPRRTQSPRESKHVPMHWESQSQVTQGRLDHQGTASTCPCIERANLELPKADPITKGKKATPNCCRLKSPNGKQHQTVEVGWGIIDDDKCALIPASPSSSSCIWNVKAPNLMHGSMPLANE